MSAGPEAAPAAGSDAPTALVRLAIRVRADRAEAALADLLPVLAAGAEERDAGDAIEYAIYGEPGALPSEARLRALAGDAILAVAVEPVAPGWESAWHAHVPRTVAGALAVRPPWIPGEPGDLVLDPGLAFGAGTHPTTALSLELLQELPVDGALCDWGAGSGVLAVAAARLGFAPVTAVEVDRAAAALSARNAARNGLAVTPLVRDLTREPAPWAPTVTANLTLPLLEAVARTTLRPPERLLASGVLEARAGDAAAAWAPLGLRETRRAHRDGWAALVLEAA